MKKSRLMILSVAASFLVALTGCTGGSDGGNKIPEATEPVKDYAVHSVAGTLHDVNVDFENAAGDFVKNRSSRYSLVTGDAAAGAATGFIRKQVLAATGASLSVAETDDVVLSEEYIVVGDAALFARAGFTMPSYDVLGYSGYTIRTYSKTVFIMANSARGYQLASLAFLRAVLGYDMISGDMVIFEKDGEKMPALDVVERPDFDFNQNSNTMTADSIYGMGFSTGSVFINTGTNWMHNIQDFTTAAEKAAHPKWFSDNGAAGKEQACFTAHGDREEYDLMVQTYAESVIEFMNQNPSVNNIVISLKDHTEGDGVNMSDVRRCTCDACLASYEFYGETISGAMLSFVNDVADVVDAYIRDDTNDVPADKEFNVVLLAYQDTLRAPTLKDASKHEILDEEGKGQATDEYRFYLDEDGNVYSELRQDEQGNPVKLRCGERVGIMYAASGANYLYSFYDTENAYYADIIKSWAGITDKMYFWTYETNYYNYLYPFNSYDSFAENMRFLKSYGGKFIYSEGTWENANCSGFAKLRDYIASKCEFDVNYDYAEAVNKFFQYYFADAEPQMRRFFDEVQLNLRAMEAKTGTSVHSDDLAKAEVWPEGMIRSWMRLIDEAYGAIAHYQTTDPATYEVLSRHILIESVFPRFVLCTTYASSFDDEELLQMRLDFKKDFTALKNTTHKEHTTIEVVYSLWGI